MSPSEPRHIMIRASAGSGKTYSLTNRFIALLARGAAPSRIVALTFTRKAAGEFFEAIVHKLAAAAGSDPGAAQLATDIGAGELRRADFLRLLELLLEQMSRLRLGTLDGFYGGLARAFPFELGLAGDFELLPDYAQDREQRRVLSALFAAPAGLSPAQDALLEAFKLATFGNDSKRLRRDLEAFVHDHHELFLGGPDADCWGQPARIWPEPPWWAGVGEVPPGAERALYDWAEAAPLTADHRERWRRFLDELRRWQPGAPLGGATATFLEKIVAVRTALARDGADLPFNRTSYRVPPETGRILLAVVARVYRGEAARRAAATQGIHAVLRQYDEIYHRRVRGAGRLTFGDVQRLLEPAAAGRERAWETAEGRALLDFRLDGKIDHWLLDEFQDTSRTQWNILHPWIAEVLQDPVGGRTFFCVGDVKQSIYGWRGGDRRLFAEILSRYGAGPAAAIAQQELVASRRSGPDIIATVNRVFGAREVIAQLFSPELSGQWNASWQEHVTALPDRAGHAAWIHASGADAADLMIRLLREIRPVDRGLSCAILVRKNDEAIRLAAELRTRGGLPAMAESDATMAADNPFTATLLALLRRAFHPGDKLAREQVAMSPLGQVLARRDLEAPDRLAPFVTRQIAEGGFAGWARDWVGAADPVLLADDRFSRRRGREFIQAAREFDATGGRDPDEFAEFMGRYKIRDEAGAATIRIMTMHSAKGLDFDVVFLPDLERDSLEERRRGLARQEDARRGLAWILDLPPGWFSAADPVLSRHLATARAEAGFEALALLYVAMTRAKHGLYIITPPAAPKSTSANYQKLLTLTLGRDEQAWQVGGERFVGSGSRGDPEWFRGETPPPAPARRRAGEVLAVPPWPALRRRPARLPSGTGSGTIAAGPLLGSAPAEFSSHGTRVHALLAQVGWLGADGAAAWEATWQAAGADPGAVREAGSVLRAPALAAIWRQPPGWRGELWREKPFEIILDHAWVSGVFDRVVVDGDAAGRPLAVRVFDFKTDRSAGAEDAAVIARYAAQLGTYRRVLAALTALPLERIAAEVVLTAGLRVVPIPGPGG